jgi:hypothetical protein
VKLDCNFAAASLRLYHASQGDELIRDLRLSYSKISSV